jgi:hypothetical protein
LSPNWAMIATSNEFFSNDQACWPRDVF